MLYEVITHLTGYDLPLEQIKRFRQAGSITPGHPEVHVTPGVETTTGPLGQGVMNSVGMAIAEAHLAAVFNRPGHDIYVFDPEDLGSDMSPTERVSAFDDVIRQQFMTLMNDTLVLSRTLASLAEPGS